MENERKIGIIRYIYLYLVTAITIVLIIISTIGFIRIGLEEVFGVKGWEEMETPDQYYECMDDTLFYTYSNPKGERVAKDPNMTEEEMEKEREECKKEGEEKRAMQHANNVKRELVMWFSMIIVALPMYVYHWGIIKKEAKK